MVEVALACLRVHRPIRQHQPWRVLKATAAQRSIELGGCLSHEQGGRLHQHAQELLDDAGLRVAVRDGTLECAVMDARAIASLACVELAAYKAALACERGAMVTRAVHSELVFCLSPTRHISEAFRRFGGDENTRALIVCKFDANDEDLERVRSVVKGELVAFDARPAVDEAALKKWYKVHENELEIGSLADAVLSRIAIRDVA